MRTAILLTAAALFATLTYVACNPYDPSLGEQPFRCGDEGGCPRGYECVFREGRELCINSVSASASEDAGPDGDDGDGGMEDAAVPFTCANDSELENNDSLMNPTVTPVPSETPTFSLEGLAICPDSDIDVFKYEVDADGKTMQVDVQYRSDRGQLSLDLLDENGVSIRQGNPVNGAMDHLRAELPNVAKGVYYAQVRSARPGDINNYGLTISVLAP